MTSIDPWSGAADLIPAPEGRRPRAEISALPVGAVPSLTDLFTFMRDAELRFDTLRMKIEERSFTTGGEHLTVSDVILRHPGDAKVTTTVPDRSPRGAFEVWISDGVRVRTYSSAHHLGTDRPVRPTLVGVSGDDAKDLPGASRVYRPLTDLPMETLPETFIHPAGYCQNVLSTGALRIVEVGSVGDRETIVLECDHPRTIELSADRPDFRIRVAVDRLDGVILRLEESIGGVVTRDARATEYHPDAPLLPTAFDFTFPSGATMLY
jgi:outer membrane lipoprotein-sorting protein